MAPAAAFPRKSGLSAGWHDPRIDLAEGDRGDGHRRGLAMTHTAFKRTLAAILAIATLVLPAAPSYAATARIKDIVNIEGVRDNQLVGYGLVVGLAGTGDSLNNSPFTKQSLQAMLERLGVNTAGENMRTANVAAVMVTASLPSFS